MSKITLNNTASGYNLAAINANFDKIEDALNNDVLYRDNPTGEPNQMDQTLDMNSQRIINLPEPIADSEPARFKDLKDFSLGKVKASLVPFTPYLDVTSTNVQDAIQEVKDDIISGLASEVAARQAADSVIVDRALYRTNPDGKPNTMLIPLDMGLNKITNLAAPTTSNDAARIVDVQNAIAGIATASTTLFSPITHVPSTNVQGAIADAVAYTDAAIAPVSASITSVSNTLNADIASRTVYNMKKLGAVGNGVADDTAVIQAAIATASASGLSSVIYFPRGNYRISGTLTLNAPGLILQGEGSTASVITALNNVGTFTGNPAAMVVMNGNNCAVRNLAIDGNIANNTARSFYGISSNAAGLNGLAIDNCIIQNVIGSGIAFAPDTGVNFDFQITNNRLANIGWAGMELYNTIGGLISGNRIATTAAHGIVTGYNSNKSNFNVSNANRIIGNYVNRSSLPTANLGGLSTRGFMIAVGAGDVNTVIANNICFDNRLAGEDGIGLGQDGIRYNQGILVIGNVVQFAGLFGIDATTGSTIQDNIIIQSTQCGIKVGTDVGGNCTDCIISNNLIIQPNNPTAFWPSVQDGGIIVSSAFSSGIYAGIKIVGNSVVDSRVGGAKLTNYGVVVDFNGVTYFNNEFSHNNFGSVKLGVAFASGSIPSGDCGWRYLNNVGPIAVPQVTGTVPNIFGNDNVSVSHAGPTTVTNMLGGFNGQALDVQMNTSNTTWQFNSNAAMYGNGNSNLTTAGGNFLRFKMHNGVWAGARTVF